mmetsp:Transcript_7487/g.13842  ORF Transcript_7487/g.13842 Transcript_7487/m.13842 type:complete len:343 (-) Transcript_7487:96-1124(-)
MVDSNESSGTSPQCTFTAWLNTMRSPSWALRALLCPGPSTSGNLPSALPPPTVVPPTGFLWRSSAPCPPLRSKRAPWSAFSCSSSSLDLGEPNEDPSWSPGSVVPGITVSLNSTITFRNPPGSCDSLAANASAPHASVVGLGGSEAFTTVPGGGGGAFGVCLYGPEASAACTYLFTMGCFRALDTSSGLPLLSGKGRKLPNPSVGGGGSICKLPGTRLALTRRTHTCPKFTCPSPNSSSSSCCVRRRTVTVSPRLPLPPCVLATSTDPGVASTTSSEASSYHRHDTSCSIARLLRSERPWLAFPAPPLLPPWAAVVAAGCPQHSTSLTGSISEGATPSRSPT